MRLCAVTGCRLHLIEPLGFDLDDSKLRRAGMDYRDKAVFEVHPNLEAWRSSAEPGRVFAFTVDGDDVYTDTNYQPGDVFPESPLDRSTSPATDGSRCSFAQPLQRGFDRGV